MNTKTTKHLDYDGPLCLDRCTFLDDWYTIEKAVHEHETGYERDDMRFTFYDSSRISDADVEGTLDHMKRIASAIRDRSAHYEKRCAVSCEGDYVYLWSPRNSRRYARVPIERANELANIIEDVTNE